VSHFHFGGVVLFFVFRSFSAFPPSSSLLSSSSEEDKEDKEEKEEEHAQNTNPELFPFLEE